MVSWPARRGRHGEGGIRTLERGQPPLRDFQSRPFNRSGTSPSAPLLALGEGYRPLQSGRMTAVATPAVADWLARRTYAAADFPLERLLAAKGATTVSVVLPAREVADTIGPIVTALTPLRDAGLLDELLVIDAASADGTAQAARAAGARVVQEADVLPEHGPARGKGDALWRAVHATRGDVVAFVDADSAGFDTRGAVQGLLGPLLTDADVAFVKGAYGRPLTVGAETVPEGGGRVTELLARPLLNLHVPELAGIVQPLAGEVAARRALLEELPFPVGYGVEIANLIDALRHAGLDALAQVDLGERRNAHQPLHALSAMAYAVLVAAERRIHSGERATAAAPAPLARPRADGTLALADVAVEERPPLRTLAAHAPAPAAPPAQP
jgi:glucosyl-3-phosphoglycerate synthase